MVTDVNPDGPAAENGVRAGDVILDIAGKPVNAPSDVRQALKEASSAGKHMVPDAHQIRRLHAFRGHAGRRRLNGGARLHICRMRASRSETREAVRFGRPRSIHGVLSAQVDLQASIVPKAVVASSLLA